MDKKYQESLNQLMYARENYPHNLEETIVDESCQTLQELINKYAKLEKALELEKKKNDIACELLDQFTEFVPSSNYPFITSDDEEERLKQWKEYIEEIAKENSNETIPNKV